MLFKTHLIFGLFVGLILSYYFPHPLPFILIVVFSSLLPDIDSPTSKLGKNWFSKTFTAFFKHRGFVHTLFFALLGYVFLFYVWNFAAISFLIGYLVHLTLDLSTKRGLRPFWPSKRRIHGFIYTGGFTENVFFFVFLILDVFLIIARLVSL